MTGSNAPNITIRRATRADVDEAARIVNQPPGAEAIGIFGDAERAQRMGIEGARRDVGLSLETLVVAEDYGRIVGVMDSGPAGSARVGIVEIVRMLPVAVRVCTFAGTVRAFWRMRLRSRVDFDAPKGTYWIAELDVDECQRNRGIGGELLRHAESDARRLGFQQMTLVTRINNPARRLYERHGFVVTAEKTDADYERLTGVPGRVLMAKNLSPT